jgi:hypothetical protein
MSGISSDSDDILEPRPLKSPLQVVDVVLVTPRLLNNKRTEKDGEKKTAH